MDYSCHSSSSGQKSSSSSMVPETNNNNNNNDNTAVSTTIWNLHQQTHAFFGCLKSSSPPPPPPSQHQQHHHQQQPYHHQNHAGGHILHQGRRHLRQMERLLTSLVEEVDQETLWNVSNRIQQEQQQQQQQQQQNHHGQQQPGMATMTPAFGDITSVPGASLTTTAPSGAFNYFLQVDLWTILTRLPILPDDGQALCLAILKQTACLFRRLWNQNNSNDNSNDNRNASSSSSSSTANNNNNNNPTNMPLPLLSVQDVEHLLQRILDHPTEWAWSCGWISIVNDACSLATFAQQQEQEQQQLLISMPLCISLLHRLLPECTQQLVTTAMQATTTTVATTTRRRGQEVQQQAAPRQQPSDENIVRKNEQQISCRVLISILLRQVVNMSRRRHHQHRHPYHDNLHQQGDTITTMQQHEQEQEQQSRFLSLEDWLLHWHLTILLTTGNDGLATKSTSTKAFLAATPNQNAAALADVQQLTKGLVQYLNALVDHAQDSLDQAAATILDASSTLAAASATPSESPLPMNDVHHGQQPQPQQAYHDSDNSYETVWQCLQHVQLATETLGHFHHDYSNNDSVILAEWQELLVMNSSSKRQGRQQQQQQQNMSVPVSRSLELWNSMAVSMVKMPQGWDEMFPEMLLQICETLLELSHQGLFCRSQRIFLVTVQQQQQQQQQQHAVSSLVEEELLSESERQIVIMTFLRLLRYPFLLLSPIAEPLWTVMTSEIQMANSNSNTKSSSHHHHQCDTAIKRMVQVAVLKLTKMDAELSSRGGCAGQYYNYNNDPSVAARNHIADSMETEHDDTSSSSVAERLVDMLKTCDMNAGAADASSSTQHQYQHEQPPLANHAAFDPFKAVFENQVIVYNNN